MARLKQGQALFEVFGSTPSTPVQRKPNGWHGVEPPAPEAKAPQAPSVADRAAPPPSENSDGELPAWFKLEDDRLVLTLNARRAGVTLFVILAVLAGMFILGDRFGGIGYRRGLAAAQGSGALPVASEIDAVRAQAPASHVVEGLLVNSEGQPVTLKGAPGSGSASSPWVDGLTYIVIQEFAPGAMAEAGKAKEFLAGHGVASEAVVLPTGSIQLLSLQGFNMKEPGQKAAGEQFLDRIHRLGTDYYASGGRYRLKGYFKAIKNDG